jgi:prepilin-type N-terminal cleavage/methylation domain-containing protein
MRRGFTLIEILVATAIFMTVMVVAVGIFGTTMGSSSTSSQLRQTAQTARYVFESMAREIRSAHGLVINQANGGQTMVIKPFDYDAAGKTIRVNHVNKVRVDDNGKSRYSVVQKLYKWTNWLNLEIYESV